ncbi:MAG: hypothetical protein CMM45_10865 [Rhodospirillaceae bacterium]|nr:hypothetical protein [Rhodospirillaceae bacterium]
MSERLRPDYTRSATLQDILDSHGSAEDALTAGAPYAALIKALESSNEPLAATARIMCGVLPKEPPIPAAENGIIQALVHWCHGNTGPLRSIEGVGPNWAYFQALLAKPEINTLMLCGPLTQHGIPTDPIPGFRVESVMLKRDDAPFSLQDLLPAGFRPDVVFILDIYGARLPESLYDISAPIIFFNMDSDFQLPRQYQDLNRADLIICNSLHEHRQLAGIYPCPVLALTANALSFDPVELSLAANDKDLDLLHTGLSFTPIMREKAQLLFRLATIDNPKLKIRFHHGFMKNDEYLAAIRQAKYVPVFSARMTGGIQTRSMDTLCNGGALLLGGDDTAVELLGPLRDRLRAVGANDEETAVTLMAGVGTGMKRSPFGQASVKQALERLFLPEGGPAARLLRFGLFEWARTGYRRPENSHRRTTSVSRLDDCLVCARTGTSDSASYFALAHFRALEAVIERPLDAGNRSRVETIFDEANQNGPGSLVITFNQGRYLWMIDDKKGAATHFTAIISSPERLIYEPTRDLLMLKLFDAAAEMFPAQDYFMALAEDLTLGKIGAPTAKNIIIATAHTYMGLGKLQTEDLPAGLMHLDQALELFADHFPAARLRFKACYANKAPYPEIAAAFDHAVNCYPPVMTNLLPYAISTELRANRQEEALELIKTWAYFITRCTWQDGKEPEIPEVTFKSVRAFYLDLPDHLQTALAKRFPAEFLTT